MKIITKAPKLQNGYKETDIRKVRKYQISNNCLPQMGTTFDNENKEQPED